MEYCYNKRRRRSPGVNLTGYVEGRRYENCTRRPTRERTLVGDRLAAGKGLYHKHLVGHFGCVNAIEFAHGIEDNPAWLISGGDDRRVLAWNINQNLYKNPTPVCMQAQHNSNIFCLSFDVGNEKIFSGETQETTPRDQYVCDVNGNTDNSTSEETSDKPNIGKIKLLTSVKTPKITPVFRRRRNSYDKALAEMRDSYDRVFTDVMDYTVDSPAVIPVDVSHQNIDSGITHRRSDSLDSQVSTRPKSNNSSVSIRRQISSAIPNDLPSVIKLAKSRSYAKLGDDVIEPDFEQKDVSANGKWHASFPVDAKSKSKGRKKSKKVHKGNFLQNILFISKSGYARK